MDRIEVWKGIAQIFAYAVGIGAAGLSVFTYLSNARRERTRLLFELYERFYERPDLKAIWRRIDEEGTSFLLSGGEPDLAAAFDELLNFFELIALLRRRHELRLWEIQGLFAYPLARLGAEDGARAYLRAYDYENLSSLLEELGYPGRGERKD